MTSQIFLAPTAAFVTALGGRRRCLGVESATARRELDVSWAITCCWGGSGDPLRVAGVLHKPALGVGDFTPGLHVPFAAWSFLSCRCHLWLTGFGVRAAGHCFHLRNTARRPRHFTSRRARAVGQLAAAPAPSSCVFVQ